MNSDPKNEPDISELAFAASRSRPCDFIFHVIGREAATDLELGAADHVDAGQWNSNPAGASLMRVVA